jgi:putative transposase
MKRFKSARQTQWFVSVHDQVANLFHSPYPKSTTAAAAAIRAAAALLSGAKFSHTTAVA